jgi:hypothetical protein
MRLRETQERNADFTGPARAECGLFHGAAGPTSAEWGLSIDVTGVVRPTSGECGLFHDVAGPPLMRNVDCSMMQRDPQVRNAD